MIGLNLLLSLWFYPQLLSYQVSNNAGRFIQLQNIPESRMYVFRYKRSTAALHFYSRRVVPSADSLSLLPAGCWLLTAQEGKAIIEDSGRAFTEMKSGAGFHISMLTPAFLNHRTRPQVLENWYILRLDE